MRRKEERSKQGQTNHNLRQNNTAHPVYIILIEQCKHNCAQTEQM